MAPSDYVQRWAREGGTLHKYDSILNYDAYQSIPGWFDFDNIYDHVVSEARDGAVFVEVGCYLGKSTAYLASRVAMARKQITVFGVDPWLGWADTGPISIFLQFLSCIAQAGLMDLIVPLRMVSQCAARLFDDNSVDFCFIDGDHTYEAVMEDLHLWFPKIKVGGIIGGHDYVASQDFPGVRQAVDEFFKGQAVDVSRTSWCA